MSRAWVVLQELFQATSLIAPADPPDGGSIALQSGCEIAHALASGNGQDDPGVLHLEPRQAAVMGDELQDGPIGGRDGQRAGSSTTHEDASDKDYPQHNR
jgi:hypothetical protein